MTGKLPESIFLVGIGGCGMSALAELSHGKGLSVAGSDLADGATISRLKDLGITVFNTHEAANINDYDSIVVSSAIPDTNPEIEEAKRAKKTILHRSDLLSLLMQDYSAVTVAGTHGKTTTTAMIAHVLMELGQDPTLALGGRMRRFHAPAHLGKSNLFVAEADESDGSFLKYKPYISVLTNVEADHLDYYKSIEDLNEAFEQYLNNTDEEGVAVVGWNNKVSREIGQKFTRNRLTYGSVIGCDVRSTSYQCVNGELVFKAVVERDLVEVKMNMVGKHNMENALCALAVARALELDVHKAAQALGSFSGVERRMAFLHNSKNTIILDDYAHNPGKMAACLEAVKSSWRSHKLHVVFQAHRYSRLETMFEGMMDAMQAADVVYVLPVYSAGEETSLDFSPERLAKEIESRCNNKTFACKSFQEAVESIHRELTPNSIVLTVGAGDVWKVGEMLKELVT